MLLIAVLILGRIVSKGAGSELFNQSARIVISATMLLLIFVAGVVDVNLIFTLFILYVPFVDVIPGRFGGQYTALNIFNVYTFILLMCWIIDKLRRDRPFFVRTGMMKMAILFVFFSLLSYAVNGFGYGTSYLVSSIYNLKRWIDPVLLFFIAAGLTQSRDSRRDAVIAILLGTMMVVFLAIKDVSQITHFDWKRRVTGVADQPNMLGAFTVDYLSLYIGILFVNYRKKLYWLTMIPIWWGLRTVAVTFSRGAYASLIVCTLFLSFLRSKALFCVVLGIYLFIAVNLWVLPLAVRERIEMTIKGEKLYGEGVELEESSSSRVDAWKSVLELVRTKPLLGYGIGMVGTYLTYYAGIMIGDVHNSFLLLAAEYGLLTLMAFLGTMLMGMRTSWYIYKFSNDEIFKGAALGFIGGILGLFVNCLFGSHMTTLWEIGYYWILLAIFANEERQLRDEAAAALTNRA